MKIIIRSDSVTLEGYVNAVERNSKPLTERGVTFIERIGAGAFKRAISRAKDIRILLNHQADRDLGGLSDGNLELEEDNIGLKARAVVTDPEVIEDAKRGNLVGWSFGFEDTEDGVKQMRDEESGYPLRKVNDLNLFEVSILNRKRSPAYVGTLVNVRDDGTEERTLISEEYIPEDIETIDEATKEAISEIREEPKEEPEAPEVKEVSSEYYARYKNIIAELKGLVKS
jgi:HK97 family phage prohead protease